MSGMSCLHGLWAAYMVVLCQALHAIIYIVRHTRLDNVEHDMQSSPLDCTNSGTTSGVTYHHRTWTTYTVKQLRAWHSIIALRQHRQGQTTLGVACHHRPWKVYTTRKRRLWDIIIGFEMHTESHDVAHCDCIIALGRHTWSNYV